MKENEGRTYCDIPRLARQMAEFTAPGTDCGWRINGLERYNHQHWNDFEDLKLTTPARICSGASGWETRPTIDMGWSDPYNKSFRQVLLTMPQLQRGRILSDSMNNFNTRLTCLSVNLSSGIVDCVGDILPARDMLFIPNSGSMWPFGA